MQDDPGIPGLMERLRVAELYIQVLSNVQEKKDTYDRDCVMRVNETRSAYTTKCLAVAVAYTVQSTSEMLFDAAITNGSSQPTSQTGTSGLVSNTLYASVVVWVSPFLIWSYQSTKAAPAVARATAWLKGTCCCCDWAAETLLSKPVALASTHFLVLQALMSPTLFGWAWKAVATSLLSLTEVDFKKGTCYTHDPPHPPFMKVSATRQ